MIMPDLWGKGFTWIGCRWFMKELVVQLVMFANRRRFLHRYFLWVLVSYRRMHLLDRWSIPRKIQVATLISIKIDKFGRTPSDRNFNIVQMWLLAFGPGTNGDLSRRRNVTWRWRFQKVGGTRTLQREQWPSIVTRTLLSFSIISVWEVMFNRVSKRVRNRRLDIKQFNVELCFIACPIYRRFSARPQYLHILLERREYLNYWIGEAVGEVLASIYSGTETRAALLFKF